MRDHPTNYVVDMRGGKLSYSGEKLQILIIKLYYRQLVPLREYFIRILDNRLMIIHIYSSHKYGQVQREATNSPGKGGGEVFL